MFVISYAYYDEYCNLAVFETREEAQSLADRLGGSDCHINVEEINQPTNFSFEFSWHNDEAEPKIDSVCTCSDSKDSISTSEYGSSGHVIASSYDEALKKIKAAMSH